MLADCEAQLKANSKVKDFSRIPRGKPQRSGRRRWVAAAAVLLLPVIALAVTEFAGVTHLFRQQAKPEPTKPGGDPPPVVAEKKDPPVPAVNSKPVVVAPFTDADVQRITALPAAQQVEEVRRELKRRNPDFDGKIEHKIEGGVVTEFRIVTDQVTDIAPIRIFDALRVLDCSGTSTATPNGPESNGLLADLAPLKGMNLAALTHLYLGQTQVSGAGLAHFQGMPLVLLWIGNTDITDLTSMKSMPLEDIRLNPKSITQGLDNLRDMKSLKTIGIAYNQSWPAAEFWERYDKGEFKK